MGLIILSINSLYAQDNTDTQLNIRENISPLIVFEEELYVSPALKSYKRPSSLSQVNASYFYNQQDLFIRQEGSGDQGFRVDAQSYLKSTSETTLWGSAFYINEKTTDLNYNESNDYDLIYPYVMADSIGGDLKSETYYFRGGLSRRINTFEYGMQASFRGVQAYRDHDPRPLNLTSDIKLDLSVSTKINSKHAVSIDLNGQKYNQSNVLDFASELGAPLVFHDAGLGVYNSLLAGSRLSANYNGYRYGVQLNLIPASKDGLIAQLGVNHFHVEKLLSSIIYPIAEVDDRNFHGLIGYTSSNKHRDVSFKLSAQHKLRNGTEAKFNNRDSEAAIQKVSEDIRYRNTRNQLRLEALYGRKTAEFDFYIQGKVQYFEDNQNYVSPDRTMDYQNLLVGLNITGVKPLKKAVLSTQLGAQKLQNIDANYFWSDVNWESGIYDMLTSNFQYVSSSSFQVLGKLRVDYSLPKDLNFFVQASGNYTNFTDSYQGKRFIISTGFIF